MFTKIYFEFRRSFVMKLKRIKSYYPENLGCSFDIARLDFMLKMTFFFIPKPFFNIMMNVYMVQNQDL